MLRWLFEHGGDATQPPQFDIMDETEALFRPFYPIVQVIDGSALSDRRTLREDIRHALSWGQAVLLTPWEYTNGKRYTWTPDSLVELIGGSTSQDLIAHRVT